MPHDNDFEFSTLKNVSCVNGDVVDRASRPNSGLLQRGADVVALVAVSDADCDTTGVKLTGSIFVFDRDIGGKELAYDFDDCLDGTRVRLGHKRVLEFEVCPAVSCGAVDGICRSTSVKRGDTKP